MCSGAENARAIGNVGEYSKGSPFKRIPMRGMKSFVRDHTTFYGGANVLFVISLVMLLLGGGRGINPTIRSQEDKRPLIVELVSRELLRKLGGEWRLTCTGLFVFFVYHSHPTPPSRFWSSLFYPSFTPRFILSYPTRFHFLLLQFTFWRIKVNSIHLK
jgi:hypothetical protein